MAKPSQQQIPVRTPAKNIPAREANVESTPAISEAQLDWQENLARSPRLAARTDRIMFALYILIVAAFAAAVYFLVRH